MKHADARRRLAAHLFKVLAVGLGLVIALVAAAAAGYASANLRVENTLEVRQHANAWLAAVLDVEIGAWDYLITGEEAMLEPYRRALETEHQQAARLRRLVEGNPGQVARVEAARAEAEAALALFADIVSLAQAGQKPMAIQRVARHESVERLDRFRSHLHRVLAGEEQSLRDRRAAAERRGVVAGAAATVAAIAAFALLGITSRLRRTREQMVEQAAQDGRNRLRVLSNLAASLSDTRTRGEVASVVVEHGMRAAAADTCTLYLLDSQGKTLELVGERGVAAGVLDEIRRISEPGPGQPPLFARLRSGKGIWAENEQQYEAHYPSLAKLDVDGPRARAFWSLPLVVEGRPIGLLGMGYFQPRAFPAEERAFFETVAQQCGQALLRAIRREAEDEARHWLATTLLSIGDGVIATDPQGGVTFMNPVAERLTGWIEAEARGRRLEEVFVVLPEAGGAPIESPVDQVLRAGTVVGLASHTLLHARNGTTVPIDNSGAPIRGEDGRLYGVVLVFRDASREKRERDQREFLAGAGEALMSSLDYQATLTAVARLAVPVIADWCAVDLKDDANKPAYQAAVAHAEPSKLQLARELREKYPPDPEARTGAPEVIRSGKAELYREISAEMLAAAARDPEHRRMIEALRLRSAIIVPLRGRTRVLGAMTFIHAESGRRYTEADLAFAQNFADRAAMAIENAIALKETAEAHAEERLLRAQSELASRAKDEFLAMVSHELRTPLNAVLGWTVILRRRNPTPEVERGLSVIERNARTQAKLIEDVLDISRIISGKLSLSLGPTKIAEALEAAIETVTPAADAKSINLQVEPVDESLTITADSNRVQQIVWNLLSNAVKFTPKGGTVKVKAARNGPDVLVSVEDSGEGIRPDVLPVIFEPFQQADASTTRRHGGLGLGLAIVKQLVTAHGGTVQATSAGPGTGACFLVRLPARSVVPAIGRGVPLVTGTELREPVPAVSAACPRLDGLRLLVVDDERDALVLVGEVLRELGAEVELVSSAAEALDKLPALRPNVLVSDIGMPEIDGYMLLRRLRALPADQGGGTPAVALTAYARREDAKRAMDAGFQHFVAKPIDPDELAGVIAALAGLAAGQDVSKGPRSTLPPRNADPGQ